MELEAGDISTPAGGGFPRESIAALLQLYPGNWEPCNTIKSHLTTNLTREIYWGEEKNAVVSEQKDR